MRFPAALWIVLLAGVTASDRIAEPRPAPPETLRVLFIGNSLTAENNLPQLVRSIAAAGRRISIRTGAVTTANFSLEDHWKGGKARPTIAAKRWDVVVLQQGPSALPESQVLLREYVKRFDGEIRQAGAKTALYMVWPSKARFFDFDGVQTSYTAAAADVHGLLLPAGQAWRLAWQRDPNLPLYGDDGFHPGLLGSYLAALVIYHGLTGEDIAGQPAIPMTPALSASRLNVLHDSAREAVTTSGRRE